VYPVCFYSHRSVTVYVGPRPAPAGVLDFNLHNISFCRLSHIFDRYTKGDKESVRSLAQRRSWDPITGIHVMSRAGIYPMPRSHESKHLPSVAYCQCLASLPYSLCSASLDNFPTLSNLILLRFSVQRNVPAATLLSAAHLGQHQLLVPQRRRLPVRMPCKISQSLRFQPKEIQSSNHGRLPGLNCICKDGRLSQILSLKKPFSSQPFHYRTRTHSPSTILQRTSFCSNHFL
jgi:hypothetical protein